MSMNLDTLRSHCERLLDQWQWRDGNLTHEDGCDLGLDIADDAMVLIDEVEQLRAAAEKLPPPVMLMAAAMLDLASDKFSNHGCNDMPQATIALWTPEMWRDMTAGERDDDDDDYVPQCDWFTMSICADQLRAAAEANGSET